MVGLGIARPRSTAPASNHTLGVLAPVYLWPGRHDYRLTSIIQRTTCYG